MRGKRLGYAGIGAGVLALVVAGCVDPNTPTLIGVTMAHDRL